MTKQLLTKTGITELIEQNRFTYEHQPDRIIADYRGECAFTKDYNGRQILELLQNADDAGSKNVLIELNTIKKELVVSDNGLHPFDKDGIKSLMLANLSSKNKKEFIGNKGLGFRSILNWASSITIITNGVELTFSPDIAKREFNEIVKDEKLKQKMLKEKNLPAGSVPFPVLAIPDNPKINEIVHDWTTIIKIQYISEFEQDIKDQLVKSENKKKITGLRPEILLFLNCINKLEINIDGYRSILEATIKKDNFTRIGDEEWHILDSDNKTIQNGDKHYRIKIAWKKDLSDDFNKLFTYFPTQVSINLPCLIHATFDLDVARNYLNKTEANSYILHELVEMLKQLALDISKDGLSWLPYKLLTPSVRDSNEILIKFYDELDSVKKIIPIYPCVDGNYLTLDEVKFYNTNFSKWVFDNDFTSVFPDLLLAPNIPDFNEWSMLYFKKYDLEIWRRKINVLSQKIQGKLKAIELRADILTYLLEPDFKPHPAKKYDLLINNKGIIIEEGGVVFTPRMQSKEEFHKPQYLNLDFINRDLYDLLISKHKIAFKQGEPDSREINRLFNDIINIQPYDSNNVIKKIISGTREHLESVKIEQQPEVIKEMVQSVFINYKELEEKQEWFSEPFPLVDKKMNIKSANNLFLNATFPSGQLTEDLYDGIFSQSNYVAELDFFDIMSDDQQLIEEFFIWMGVNKYAKLNTSFELIWNRWANDDFINLVFTNEKEKPKDVTQYIYKGFCIDEFEETVKKLSPEKLLLLTLKDELIRQKLEKSHGDSFWYVYNRNSHSIYGLSYIAFQLISLNHFKEFLIDNHNIPFINEFNIDSKNGLLKKYDVNDSDIKYLLSKLGAKNSINDLNPDRIYKILHSYKELDFEGKTTQRFYTLALNSLEKRSKETGYSPSPENLKGLEVYAKCNVQRRWLPASDVCYSNDTVLPESILKDKFILNVPKRFGESKVKQYLGVQLFNDLKLNIVPDSLIDHPVNKSLKEELEKLNKYILAIRISDPIMKPDTKVAAANSLKGAKLTLVERGQYTVNDGRKNDLKNFEFINEGNNFYLCADETRNLQSLKSESAFCDAISEIYCIVFKVWEHRSLYRSAFKEGIRDLDHQFKKDGEEELLYQAGVLLGLSEEEKNFWTSVFRIKEIDFPKDIAEKSLKRKIRKELGISLSKQYKKVDFENFDNQASYEFLRDLCQKLSISLSEIKEGYPNFPMLIKWHLKQLNIELDSIEPIFGASLWETLKNSSESKQEKFIPTLDKLRPWFNGMRWDQLVELINEIDVDYSGTLIKFIKENFSISLNLSRKLDPPKILYNNLLTKYGIEESQLTDSERSFLYFPNKDERLIQIFEQYQEESVENDIDDSKVQRKGLKVVKASLVDILPQDPKSKVAGKGSGMHDPASDRRKNVQEKKLKNL